MQKRISVLIMWFCVLMYSCMKNTHMKEIGKSVDSLRKNLIHSLGWLHSKRIVDLLQGSISYIPNCSSICVQFCFFKKWMKMGKKNKMRNFFFLMPKMCQILSLFSRNFEYNSNLNEIQFFHNDMKKSKWKIKSRRNWSVYVRQ